MKIKTFWVVTYPSDISTLQDICFEVDAQSIYLQFKGGLDPEDIYSFYTDRRSAETAAKWLMQN